MPTVFVSQLPHKKDPVTGMWVPGYNIHPASAHGTVKILLPPKAPFQTSAQLVPQLGEVMKYSFKRGDHLLLLGDPVIIATMVAMVSVKGDFRVLRWDRNIGQYVSVVVNARLAA